MRVLAIDRVSKAFGDTRAVDGVSLSVGEGEVCVLLGPSGCGKSTLLRIVAGLEPPDAGTVAIRGGDVTRADPRDRDVAMVFQSYALYPHMTVRENLSFPLRVRGVGTSEIRSRVDEAAALLGITELADRKPAALSGGQRQRVAIGRAIVRRPALFLLDEPLSNLDAQLRARMRVELAELFARLRATVLYVTHDQVEAMTLGHRIALVRAGRLEQIGSPTDLYDRPETTFAATFIGTPPMNLVDVDVVRRELSLPGTAPADAVTVGVRPEDLRVDRDGPWPATVEHVEHLGAESIVHVRLAGARVQVRVPGASRDGVGTRLALQPTRLHYFDRESRRVDERGSGDR